MKKIKILETIRQGKVGGGETHVLELTSNLDLSKFEPIVLSFTDGQMVDELKRRGIKTKVIYTEKGFDINVWKQVLQFVKDEKIDMIHAHGTRAYSNVFWAAKRLKLPMVYTVHGWSFHIDQKLHIRKFREMTERLLTHNADTTICVSKSNEQDGIKRFNMKRSTVIYNAVDFTKFDRSNTFSDLRQQIGIDASKTVIGYIVRITKQKDPFTMLQAMKLVCEQSKDIILLMVGDGDLKDEAIQLAKDLKIDDQVIFLPFRTDIPNVLNAIDIYCLPSLWEGFPIGILEAMAMGKPVVASPVDGTFEMVRNGETGILVEQQKPKELAEALLHLHHHPELRKKIIEKAFVYVTSNFGIKKMVKEVEAVYEKLSNSKIA